MHKKRHSSDSFRSCAARTIIWRIGAANQMGIAITAHIDAAEQQVGGCAALPFEFSFFMLVAYFITEYVSFTFVCWDVCVSGPSAPTSSGSSLPWTHKHTYVQTWRRPIEVKLHYRMCFKRDSNGSIADFDINLNETLNWDKLYFAKQHDLSWWGKGSPPPPTHIWWQCALWQRRRRRCNGTTTTAAATGWISCRMNNTTSKQERGAKAGICMRGWISTRHTYCILEENDIPCSKMCIKFSECPIICCGN